MIRPAGHHATTGALAQDQPQSQRTGHRLTLIRQEDGALIFRCAPVPRYAPHNGARLVACEPLKAGLPPRCPACPGQNSLS